MGAMSRFQSVTLVQLVLSIRGLRCSARPVMCCVGRDVDSCRNWSAKNRGATVVFSLPGRDQAALNPQWPVEPEMNLPGSPWAQAAAVWPALGHADLRTGQAVGPSNPGVPGRGVGSTQDMSRKGELPGRVLITPGGPPEVATL